MSGAIREVDELNDYSASTVVPAEPSTGRARAMVCGPCEASFVSGEVKTMGSFGPCAICGTNLGGPLTPEQLTEARELAAEAAGDIAEALGLPTDTEPAPPPIEPTTCDRCDEPVEDCNCPRLGPVAARIITPGIDDVLDAFESEEDVVNANRELLEGTPQTVEQYEKWRRLYGEIMNESNKRLRNRGVTLIVAVPNPNGLGCVFTGIDMARFKAAQSTGIFLPGGEDYEVVLTLPASERVDLHKAGREDFVRKFIDVVCEAVLEQKAQYERKQGMH